MAEEDVSYLQEISDHIHILESFMVGVAKEDFLNDVEKQFAVARAFEIIGEASSKLSEQFRGAHAEIDWRGLKAMRNLLIHEYAYVDADEVWKAWEEDIQGLKQHVEKFLQS